jgi:hypothetical protein
MPTDDIEDEPLFQKLTEEEQTKYDELRLLTTTHVSEKVRAECLAEMERGRKSGWKRF